MHDTELDGIGTFHSLGKIEKGAIFAALKKPHSFKEKTHNHATSYQTLTRKGRPH